MCTCFCFVRQKDRCLPGGIPATHHDHFFLAAHRRLNGRGAKINAHALKQVYIFKLQLAYCAPVAITTVFPSTTRPSSSSTLYGFFAAQLLGAARDDHFGPKLLNLGVGAAGQILSGDSRWKAQ